MKRFTILLGLAVLLLTPAVLADVPKLINFQGILRDGSGNPVGDGSYTVRFRIYDDSTTAESNFLWTETVPLQTTGGLFTVRLGDDTPLPDTLFAGVNRFVGVKVNVDPEMPRVRFISVPFAFYAHRSDTAQFAFNVIGGTFLPLAGGTMTGAITNTGDPSITMGKGSFGSGNSNTGINTFVAGENNSAIADYATVSGGSGNTAEAVGATVGGGKFNNARGQFSVVGGGGNATPIDSNSASGQNSVIGGGRQNVASADITTVAGGGTNMAIGAASTVGGGATNTASGTRSTVSGGGFNAASGSRATVGGGTNNTAAGDSSTVSGGAHNTTSFVGTTVGGGAQNWANAQYATVAGGLSDTAFAAFSTVGGGNSNYAGLASSTVSGGVFNRAMGPVSTVGGGSRDTASGGYSTVPGGIGNHASGNYSFTAGRRAKAIHAGAFVWGDSTDADFASTAVNQFLIRANNVGIGTNGPTKKLEVAGSIKVGANDTIFSSNISSNSPLSLQAPAGTTRMFINDVNGNVGIGTTSPTTRLQVTGGQLSVETGTSAAPAYSFAGDLNTGINGFSDFLNFVTGGTQRGSFAPDGRFIVDSRAQIGTTGAFGDPSTLYVQGSIATDVTTVVGATTLTSSRSIVLVNTGATTVTLPAAALAPGRQYTIKKISAVAGIITIDGNAAETIDGAATHSLTVQYEYVTIVSNGTSWFVVADN